MKFKRIFKTTLIISLVLGIILLSGTLILITKTINDVRNIEVNVSDQSTSYCSIFNKDNELIGNISNFENYVKLEDIKPETISAFVSIEDKKFYEHKGLNYLRILKALITNIKEGSAVEGASTISQQLIKNKYLSNEKTIVRKIKEAYLTKKLESKEDKNKIMEAYLNTIYYGNGAYGIGNASLKFFNKKPSELTLSESCILAGLIKSPNTYSPINNIENCKARRNIVLKEMLEDEKISTIEYYNAINEDIVVNEQKLITIDNLDLYSKNVLNEASQILKIDKNEILNRGYKIYTYQDKAIQSTLTKIINDDRYYQKNKYGNIADSLSIVLDNKSGGVSAVAGRSKYNLVDFKRQPGSLVKPILVYTPALEEKKIYSCSEILDEKISINNYSPRNVSDKYYGYTSIKDCVALSLNTPAVKLCNDVGIDVCKNYGSKAGLEFTNEDNGLSIALGGLNKGFTLQNITSSYLPYTNNGNYIKSGYISKIVSPQNLTIYNRLLTYNKYCSTQNAYIMTNIMQYSTHKGTSKKLSNLTYNVAGKTGTVNIKDSNLNTDAYSLAFTSEHTMSVWLGNYSMQSEYNLEGNNNGGTFATEIIRDTFDTIYIDNIPDDFIRPKDVIELPIDSISLKQNHEVCIAKNMPEKYITMELFSDENIPRNNSSIFENIPTTYLNLIENKNSFTLQLETLDYLNYSIYRIDSNSEKLIKTIKNNNGLSEFVDNQIDINKDYKYYILVSSEYSNKTAKSNFVNGKISKDYDILLTENNDNLSWLFT